MRSLQWCSNTGCQPELAAELAITWNQYMMRAGQWQAWENCLRDIIMAVGGQISIENAHRLNHCLAAICFRSYQFEESLEILERNEKLALAVGSSELLAHTYIAMAETYLNAVEPEKAEQYARQATHLARGINNRIVEADGLIDTARALVHTEQGMSEAETYLHQALAITQFEQNSVYIAKTLIFIGHIVAQRNAFEEALEHYRAALTLLESCGDKAGKGVVLSNIGKMLMELKAYDEAEKTLLDAIHISLERGNNPVAANARASLLELRKRREQAESEPVLN